MPVQDRTNEFYACVDSVQSRLPHRRQEQKQRLLPNGNASIGEFTRMASEIGGNITETTRKLGKLAQRGFVSLT